MVKVKLSDCQFCKNQYKPTRKNQKFCSQKCLGDSRVIPVEDRFWPKVDKKSKDECWHWIGAKVPSGYGHIGIRRKVYRAPRISWEIHYGKIPEGLVVRHKCDTPSCVNPNHLELGTTKQNIQDTVKRKRARGGKRKLSEQDVQCIKNDNRTLRAIANDYNITYGYVSQIKNGKSCR